MDNQKTLFLFWIALVLLMVSPSARGSPKERMIKYSTPKVRLHTDIGKHRAKRVLEEITFFSEYIDGFFRSYSISSKRENPIRCRLYSLREDFRDMRRKENVVQQAGAYFSPNNNCIVASYEGGERRAHSTLLHECTHQIIRRYFNDPPPWIDEGLACYFQAVEFDEYRNVVSQCNDFSLLNPMRSLIIREVLIDWDRFFSYEDRGRFDDEIRRGELNMGQFYIQAWGVVFFYMHGDNEEAKQVFTRFIKGMNTGRERTNLIQKDLLGRMEEFSSFFQINHKNTYDLYKEASRLGVQKKYRKAQEKLLEILEEDPYHVAALRLCAEVAWEAEDFDSSLSYWKLLYEGDPKNSMYPWRICRCLVEVGKKSNDPRTLEEAIKMGEAAVKSTKKQDAHCLAALAMAYHATGQLKKALSTMRKATRLSSCPAYKDYKDLEKKYSKELIASYKGE